MMREFFLIALIIGGLTTCSHFTNKIECREKWDDSVYGFWSGCKVNTKDGLIPERNVRVIHWIEEE
jgi:hypothetical protein